MATLFPYQKSLEHLIKLLNRQIDMNLWMFTLVDEDDWLIVACSENDYGVNTGDVFSWKETVCTQMVNHQGPNVVHDINYEEKYKQAPIVKQFSIASYIGLPMRNENHELIGTLCAIDQNTKHASIVEQASEIQPLLELAEALINQHYTIARQEKALNYFDSLSSLDEVTGLPSQNAFFSHALESKAKYDKIDCPLGIIIVEVSGLKINKGKDSLMYDDLLRLLSNEIKYLLRESDYLAKLDGSKFGIILVNVEKRFVSSLVLKISERLSRFNLRISIGADVCRQTDRIEDSIERADVHKMI